MENHIIIIDDSVDDFNLYQRILKKINPDSLLTHIKSSEKAVSFFSDSPSPYDLVLLDYHMPGQSGLDVLQTLSDKKIEIRSPVIVLTGKGDEKIAVDFLKQGVNHYLTKNAITFDSLREAIQEVNHDFLTKKREEDIQNERRSFAYTIAHDLQNPLKRIQAYCSISKRNIEKAEKYLPLIEEDIFFAMDFIKELLSYVDAGRSCMKKEKISLGCVLQKSIDHLLVPIQEKNASVNLVGDIADFPTITGAKIPLIQLFQNLIGNSIKYCDKDPVIEIKSDQNDKQVTLSIKDNGIGIPKKAVNEVFNPFFRLLSDKEQGHGLGLAIVKTIADQHNASIDIQHPKDGGTQFNITFPLK